MHNLKYKMQRKKCSIDTGPIRLDAKLHTEEVEQTPYQKLPRKSQVLLHSSWSTLFGDAVSEDKLIPARLSPSVTASLASEK